MEAYIDERLCEEFNPEEPLSHKSEDYISDPLLSDQAFCLVYVVDANKIRYANDRLIDKLRMMHHRISYKRIPLMIIMTKVDEVCLLVKDDLKKIYASKKIKERMELCSEMIGVPMSRKIYVKRCREKMEKCDRPAHFV